MPFTSTASLDLSQFLSQSPSPAALAQIDEIMLDVLQEWNQELVDYWPVLTGLSLRGWQSVYQWPRWDLFNEVEYAKWVHPKGGSTGEGAMHLFRSARQLLKSALPAMRTAIRQNPRVEAKSTLGFGLRGGLGLQRGPQLGLRRALVAASEVNIVRGITKEARRRERLRLRDERQRRR